ncbi:D-alanine--D-alanine ligase [Roseofilum reptotaenium CS-1145]|uniref:D-alanine--D-alanine ligase n=1 Tax=Roseofilum reptotaenium AO1-A TaxID=1925591 RepID=A0A1L9QXJ7_9CYAN|nr:D-alanine--D-alanine ligase [Roseofilum reptotaenium]MDB9517945.1 D-alanine--D-alanine ligase [Roseofilum reptotaenium CS-1145]OJJ27421.1 D-alanine--D-alanine ligase [Roseofilum reptotaenium AO1-A]
MSRTQSSQSPLQVLHLAGSRVSDFYHNLSMIYAKEVLQPPGVSSYYAVVNPDGFWQLGTSLDSMSEKISLQEMIARLPQIDLVVPHLFCFPGMTSFRAFFEDILGLPMVGSTSHCTALAANKAHTKSVVSAAGVRVAKGQEVRRGDRITLEPPLIVKPNSEDNSLGLTLVWDRTKIADALQVGFEHDDVLVVEEYIAGRELRVGVIERKGELWVAPMIEYLVTEENPIRTVREKLELRSDGTPDRQTPVNIVCPADLPPELFEEMADAAKKAHIALGCRDYSLYDFRVHAETDEPYLLEAGLFWSFGKISMISRMLEADAQNIEEVILELWHTAAQRTRVARGSLFKYSTTC